jgi:hypothetical protein
VSDTLGLLEEATDLARELGLVVREEALGESPGGACTLGGKRQILLNAALPASRRLEVLLDVLAAMPEAARLPTSRPLERLLAGRQAPAALPAARPRQPGDS